MIPYRERREPPKTLLSLLGSHRGADASRSRHRVGRPIRGSASLAGWCVAGPGWAAAPTFAGPSCSAASIEFRQATRCCSLLCIRRPLLRSLCLWRRLRDAQAAGDQPLGSPRMEMGTRLLLNVPGAREMRTAGLSRPFVSRWMSVQDASGCCSGD
jgi:hypothetical protein